MLVSIFTYGSEIVTKKGGGKAKTDTAEMTCLRSNIGPNKKY
jgi:hypothetical protein